jgi:hypothetical protein
MTADELRDAAILGRIVQRVEATGRFCGETLLQKSAYFLKEMFGAPISAPFRIYYYGPFSFALEDTLGTMDALDIVRTAPHEYGATYRVGKRYPQLEQRFRRTLEEVEPAIGWVQRSLVPLGVKELEPLATALFLRRETPSASLDQLATRLHEIKPHVSVTAARTAITKVERWIDENRSGSVGV